MRHFYPHNGEYGSAYYASAPSFSSSAPAPAGPSMPSMPPMQGPSSGGQQGQPGRPTASEQEVAKWGAVGQVGAALASMTGMIATTVITNRGQQQLAEQQARYARKAAPGQAMLAEKQGMLANAQAALTSAQNAYIWPLALVGVSIVGGLAFFATSTKKEKQSAKRAQADD